MAESEETVPAPITTRDMGIDTGLQVEAQAPVAPVASMTAPFISPDGKRSRRNSRSAIRSPRMNTVKENTEDSEAETEILSVNNTPLKGRKLRQAQPLEANAVMLVDKPGDEDIDQTFPELDIEAMKLSESGKSNRRGVTNETTEGGSGSPNARPTSSHSSRKRARLDTAAASKSEEEEQTASESIQLHSPRLTRSSSQTQPISPLIPNILDPKRATTQEPRSRSLSPSSRRPHRRSSSFQVSVTSASRERKQRNRRTIDASAGSPPAEANSPRLDAHNTGRGTPSHFSHSAHMSRKKDPTGRTVFARACEAGDIGQIRALLESGEHKDDINEPDNANNTPLQFAALKGHTEVVKLLLKAGCRVKNVKNFDGDTPLMDACSGGHAEIVELLLNAGVNPNPVNAKGNKAEDEVDDDAPERRRILELLEKARLRWIEDEEEPRSTNKRSAGANSNSTPGVGRSRRAVLPNYLLYTPIDLEHLYKFAEEGNKEGVSYLISCGIKPDNDCVVAAASRGHTEVLSILVKDGGAQSDPDPASVNDHTPMLAAILRGNVAVVQALLKQPGFNVRRKIDGKFYYQIALDGTHFKKQEVAQVLKSAPGMKRLMTRKQMKAERAGATTSSSGDEETEDVRQEFAVPSSAPSPDETMRSSSISEALSPLADSPEDIAMADVTPERSETPPRPQTPPAERRRRYIELIPRAVARALESDGWLHSHIENHGDAPAETRYLKSLENWMGIPTFLRSVVEPDCDPENKDDLWILGYYASIFLRHERLDDVVTLLHWDTIPVTKEWRTRAWSEYGIGEHIAKDHYWDLAPETLQKSCGVPIKSWILPIRGGIRQSSAYWYNVSVESRKKWDELPDDQCVFVKYNDFIQETVSAKAPHLRNLILRFEEPRLPGMKALGRRCVQNGREMEEPRRDPTRHPEAYIFWHHEYAEFPEKWVQGADGIEWVTEDVELA